MRPLNLALAASLLALAWAGAWAGPSGAAPLLITEPDWLAKPNAATVEKAYPVIPLSMYLPGRAQIHCQVTEIGKLDDCKVTSELPEGLGFGYGALVMASAFQMKPRMEDGRAVTGEVNVPIVFMMPEPEPLAPPSPPTSPAALAVARKLVLAVMGPGLAATRQSFDTAVQGLETEHRADMADDARAIIAKAMRESYPKRLADYQELAAQFYANAFSAAELAEVAAFLQTPAGKASLSESDESLAQNKAIGARYARIETKAAGEAFCATHACLTGELAPGPAGSLADPAWDDQPADWQVQHIRPELATSLGLAGAAQITCVVADTGSLKDCKVVREAPMGLGFGRAATGLTAYYQLGAKQLEAGAAGKTVAISIRFPPPEVPADDGAADIAPRSAHALTLARELVAARDISHETVTAWRRLQGARALQGGLGFTLADRDAMLDAMAKGAEVANAKVADLRAAALTLQLTDAQIAAATAFWKSPAGAAWNTKASEAQAHIQERTGQFVTEVWTDAGKALCASRPCYVPPVRQAIAAKPAPSTRTP